jgi:DNA-binding MarR family transcriptional regulator
MKNIPTKEHPPADDDALHQAVERIRRVMVALARRGSLRDPLAGSTEQLQLTPPQMHAVMSLGHDDGLTMGELARRGGVTEKTMTGVVDRLEQAGHVLRGRDGADRRVVRVHLTPQGRELFVSCDRHVVERMGKALSIMDPGDREALCGILERFTDELVSRAAEAAEENA